MATGMISDRSLQMVQTRRLSELRRRLAEAGTEVASGRAADAERRSGSGVLLGLENRTQGLDARLTTLRLASGRAGATQLALERVQKTVAGLGPRLLAHLGQGSAEGALATARDAALGLGSVVSGLNSAFGGQRLFAGAATDRTPLAAADTLLDAVRSVIDTAPDLASGLAQVDLYFASGGAFETDIYQGSAAPAPGIELREGDNAALSVTAASPELRLPLKALSLAAIAAERADTGDLAAFRTLAEAAGQALADAEPALIDARAGVGRVEARIEQALGWNQGEMDVVELQQARASQADPYEAATRFQNLEQQLERSLTVTARLARLNLADYI